MEECELHPGQECHNGTRLAMLEKKVEDLEAGQGREERFRKDFYEYREKASVRDAQLDAKLEGIDANVKMLVARQQEADKKPGRRWEGLVEKVFDKFFTVVVAFAVWILRGAPGLT